MVKLETIKHRLYMPPLKKYEVYGKFPWKLVIQMLLVLFTTCQIIFIVNRSTTYAYNQYILWNKIFLNKDVQGSDITITNSYNIFGIHSLVDYVQETVDNYYDINSKTIDDYKYVYTDSGFKKPPKLLVEYYDSKRAVDLGYLFEYKLYSDSLGPFSWDDVQDYLGEVKKFEIKFNFIHSLDKYINLASDCYEWELTQEYDFTFRGAVETKLGTKRINCGGTKRNITRNYAWIDLIVILLAIGSLITIVNYFHRRIEILKILTGVSPGSVSTWERLGLKEKLNLFNFWIIISFSGNLFQLFGAFLSIFEPRSELKVNEILMGFGCFFSWVGSVHYLNKRSHSYTIAKTVTRSFPILGMYIVGVVPIFMAYTFAAMCIFWQTGIYPNTPMSMIANYAVVNGDSVYAFGFAEYQEHQFIGQLYYYTFVVFFICCVHNLFIAIVESSFSSLKVRPIEYHDSSDEEETEKSPKRQENEKKQLKRQQSLLAFKKILNVGKVDTTTAYDEQTLIKIQTMDKILEEILANLESMTISITKLKDNPEYSTILEHFLTILEDQFYPVVQHFN